MNPAQKEAKLEWLKAEIPPQYLPGAVQSALSV